MLLKKSSKLPIIIKVRTLKSQEKCLINYRVMIQVLLAVIV